MVKWTTTDMIRKKNILFQLNWIFFLIFIFSVKQLISCLPKSHNLKTPALVLHSCAYPYCVCLNLRIEMDKVSFPDAFRADPSNAAEVIPGCKALLKGGIELYTSGNSQHRALYKPLFSRRNTWSRKRPFYFCNICAISDKSVFQLIR